MPRDFGRTRAGLGCASVVQASMKPGRPGAPGRRARAAAARSSRRCPPHPL